MAGTTVISNLEPGTTYHYEVVAQNENLEKSHSVVKEFTTPPSSSTSEEVTRVLHGQNGWVWLSGWVKSGYLTGEEAGPGLQGVHVHLMFYRAGVWQENRDVTTNAEGRYESGYIPRGKGTWEVKAVFPGGEGYRESESSKKEFTIRDGVRLISPYDGHCLDVSGASTADGALIQSGTCLNPATSENQVFTLVPEGEGYFEISPRHSGRCLDVTGVSTSDGAGVQQYSCLGTSQANQLFREVWHSNGTVSYVAKHSQKCLDIPGASTSWIAIQQWTCNGSTQQNFTLEPVESAPISTEVSLTPEPILNGAPGYITVSGYLKAAAYPMGGRIVHVELEKHESGSWNKITDLALSVNSEGHYQYNDEAVGQGEWRVRSHFAGDSEFAAASSAEHYFTIHGGNRIISRETGKCLSLSNALHENVNGQHFLLWDCSGSPSYGDGQVFRFWPVGNGWYEITVTSSGRCLDIPGGSTANGTDLQQWDCNHYSQQHYQLLPISGQPGWYALRPENSLKCLDVSGFGTANGTVIDQWDCTWAANQQWEIQGAP
ncbi:MAG: RICIN domain-containing protein [Solirubrobacterales bacterium]